MIKFASKSNYKPYAAPAQRKLTISSWCVYNYMCDRVYNHDYQAIKTLLCELKIIIRSIMKVRCEEQTQINVELMNKVNSTKIHKVPTEVEYVVRTPAKFFDDKLWVNIERSLLPYFTDYEYSDELFDIAIYVYQNILLTEYTALRKEIDAAYANKLNKGKASAAELKMQKINEQNEFKATNVYEWVNKLQNKYDDPNTNEYDLFLIWSTVLLRVYNTPYDDLNNFTYLLNDTITYEENEYLDAIIELRKIKPVVNNKDDFNKLKIWSLVLESVIACYNYGYYEKSCNMLDKYYKSKIEHIFSFEYKPLAFSTRCIYTVFNYFEDQDIQMIINRISKDNMEFNKKLLFTFNKDQVIKVLFSNVVKSIHSDIIINVLKELASNDDIVEFITKSNKTEEFYKVLPTYQLNNILEFDAAVNYCGDKPDWIIVFCTNYIKNKNINIDIYNEYKDVIMNLINNNLDKVNGTIKYQCVDAVDSLKVVEQTPVEKKASVWAAVGQSLRK